MIEGNKKKIKVVKPLNKPATLIGEFTILEEPVVPVIPSKIPAVVADIKNDNTKNMTAYI